MSFSLYTISIEQKKINAMLEESGGELTPEIEDALTISRDNLLSKSENYAQTILAYKALEQAADGEIKRIQAIKRTAKNVQERLKERLLTAMDVFEIDKIEAGLYKLSMRKSEAVEVEDIEKIPAKFIVIERKVDKTLLKDALKEGGVEGAKLTKNKSLIIK